MKKPILCLDFDGVLHSYSSGWKGPRNIPDPPTAGALGFLVRAVERFDVHVFSSRSKYWGGRSAMKRWLRENIIGCAGPDWSSTPRWLQDLVSTGSMGQDEWDEEVAAAAGRLVHSLYWPTSKPPAKVTLDDRALTFTGTWPELDELERFQPWNVRRRA